MSRALDVNVLLYAGDSACEYQPASADFLSTIVSDGEILYLAWITLMSYLRMATHPRIFKHPLTPRDALANVERLIAMPSVRCISEGQGFWEIYRDIAGSTPVRANLVPDAHLAAILKLHGIRTLYTHDRDFLKFPFLKVIDPLV